MPISRLTPVPLRELWPNEARDFTTWLADNLDFLGDALGMELSLVEQEARAGAFSADILAEDNSGSLVIIENQLERTDHDHLGKLITYLSNLEAKTALWITSDPRPEHEAAIHWLNEMLPADVSFFLLKLEACRIGDSPPAPRLGIIAGPSTEARQVGAQKKGLAERHLLRREFWTQLLDKAKEETQLHAGRSATEARVLNAGAGLQGVAFQYRIRQKDAQVGLRIRRRELADTKRLFDALRENEDEIQKVFGGQLEWHRQDNWETSLICRVIPGGGWQDREHWPEIQEAMVDAMVRLEKALDPQIRRLS